MGWQTSVEPEGNEQRLPDHFPVRKTALMVVHCCIGGMGETKFSEMVYAGPKPGLQHRVLPHYS